MEKYTNNLIHETSPYLLQHAHNPVNWQPWGSDALKRAKDENKLIFISIGYAACHWCHVMERESFENKEVAAKLNADFICIKVDRQERPDVDLVYMSAVQLMTGNGGWPLTCFATPDAKPFYGGTYFPPSQLLDIIGQLARTWHDNPQKIQKSATSIYKGIGESELIKGKSEHDSKVKPDEIYRILSGDFDKTEGGLKRVPKFPMPGIYRYLLQYYRVSGNEAALDHTRLTVDKILNGGIYDQLDGGIARYSTDGKWRVPHFEKMLYDNAQFVSLLSELYAITGNELYKQKLYECTGFLERELKSDTGGFYASLDADSANEEGKYYAWDHIEIDAIAGKDSELIKTYWGITKDGNWEAGKNILYVAKKPEDLSEQFHIPPENVRQTIDELKLKLKEFRTLREKPPLDTKILTSWNALMLSAYTDAWQATGDRAFYDAAINLGEFIRDKLMLEKFMIRRSLKKDTGGFLDDYAYTAQAFMNLYQVSFDENWLNLSGKIIEVVIENFFNLDTGMFHYTPAMQMDTVIRQIEVTDNVLPSSNSVMANVIYNASYYFDDDIYLKIVRQMLANITPYFTQSPSFFTNWASLHMKYTSGMEQVVVTGPEYRSIRENFTRHYFPLILFAGAERESPLFIFNDRFLHNESMIYVCRNSTCKLPVKTVGEALKQISAFNPG